MNIRALYCNMLREACYIVSDSNQHAVVIDCGVYSDKEKERLINYIADNNLKIEAHLLTHCHLDHIFGAGFLYNQYNVIPKMSPKEAPLFRRQQWQSDTFGLPLQDPVFELYEPTLEDNQLLTIGSLEIQVIYTPGHSPGGVCYLVNDTDSSSNSEQIKTVLFSGDTLFRESIGRADLPKGDFNELISSIRNRLLTLPDSTPVFPGHGFETTIGYERQNNPFLS